jgi:hypothetical protein
VALDGIPDETKASLITQLSEGDIAVVETYLSEWRKGVNVPVRFQGQGNVGFEKRATGGPVQAGRAYVVGDNPDGSWNSTTEMFIPDRPGRASSARGESCGDVRPGCRAVTVG